MVKNQKISIFANNVVYDAVDDAFAPLRWNVICIDMTDFERLNDINQRVWEQGFTANNLRDLETLSEDIKNGAAVFERIPYAQQSGLSKGSEVLCAASIICRGCPRTESETRQIYDTDDLFGEGRIQEYLVHILKIFVSFRTEALKVKSISMETKVTNFTIWNRF